MMRVLRPLLVALLCLTYFAIPTFARRAITVTERIAEIDTDQNDTNFTTAGTWGFASTSVGLCGVFNSSATPIAVEPTLTQTGYTWDRVGGIGAAFDVIATPTQAVTVFRALGTGATAATITITYTAVNQTTFSIHCVEVTGADTTGSNGANAIEQIKLSNGGSDTLDPFAITFDAATSASGAVIFFAGTQSATVWTGDTSYTLGTELNTSAPVVERKVQWLVGADDTPTWDFSATERAGGAIVEIAPAGAAGGVGKRRAMLGIGSPR